MKYQWIPVLLILSVSFYSCQDEPSVGSELSIAHLDDYSAAQLLFSSIEYDLYLENKTMALQHTHALKNRLSKSYKMFCDDEMTRIQSLANDIQYFSEELVEEDPHWSLEKLRDLKSKFMLIQTDLDYDPYLFQLWRFEEQMYFTTKTAMDPMLDLYEWEEFVMMADCMNEDWNTLRLHYPSLALFSNNKISYKIQISEKINLQKKIEEFNKAIGSDDYIKYDICDFAFRLRQSYVRYLNTFVNQEQELSPFLALI